MVKRSKVTAKKIERVKIDPKKVIKIPVELKREGEELSDYELAVVYMYLRDYNWKHAVTTVLGAQQLSETEIISKAEDLRRSPRIRAAIDKHLRSMQDLMCRDKNAVINMILQDRFAARQDGDHAAAIRADELVAKVCGYSVEKKDVVLRDLRTLSDADLDALLQNMDVIDVDVENKDPKLQVNLPSTPSKRLSRTMEKTLKRVNEKDKK